MINTSYHPENHEKQRKTNYLIPQTCFGIQNQNDIFYDGFPGGSYGKESACNAGDLGLNPGLERSPGEGDGYPLQYSCLENPMDREAWWATVHGVQKSPT